MSPKNAVGNMRSVARDIFLHALSYSAISKAFESQVQYERGVLRIAEDLFDLSAYSRVFVVSMGKAAHSMVEALTAQVGGMTGIVAASTAPHSQVHGFRYFEGGHPTPNAESFRAGEAILRALSSQTARSLVIYLISGGGSSIVEKPVDEEIKLSDMIAMHRALVLSGAPIAEINAIRKHLSAVKGGRMARAAAAAQQVSIMVSDVPENALDSLASGPTMPDSSTVEDCYRIADQYQLLPSFPAAVRELFEQRALEETPKAGDSAFHRSRWWPVLSNRSVVEAASAKAVMSGFAVEVDNTCDDWNYRSEEHTS